MHPDGGVAVEELAEGRRTSGNGLSRMKDGERERSRSCWEVDVGMEDEAED